MPVPDSPATVERICLRDAAYERLRDWIIEGTLVPGEPLRDEALAEALGMSRTPIREAMQRLVDEGLVVTTSSRRTFVSEVSMTQAREIFPIVIELEALAISLAAPSIDDDALDRMRDANQMLASALAAQDTAQALEADTAFHTVFIDLAGNRELISLLDEEKSKVKRIERTFWGSADRADSIHDHEELVQALAAHDVARAQEIVRRNWNRGLAWLCRPQRAASREQ
jgi:DNA-binding GntR family transcriptional regulator